MLCFPIFHSNRIAILIEWAALLIYYISVFVNKITILVKFRAKVWFLKQNFLVNECLVAGVSELIAHNKGSINSNVLVALQANRVGDFNC